MSAIGCYQTSITESMFRHCKRTANLIRNAKEVVLIAQPLTIARLDVSTNLRTLVTMSNDSVDPHQLQAIFQQKHSLRSRIRKQLKNMDPIQRSQEDNAIQDVVLKSSWFKASKSLCAYISCASLREVDTSRIVSEILSNQTNECRTQERKKLYVPRVEDTNSNMRMLRLSSVDDLVLNSMNILEPSLTDPDGNQCEDVMQASEPVDLVILPGLAFDRSGRRLGRSGGVIVMHGKYGSYYDLFLKKYQKLVQEQKWKRPLLVALSYSVQIVEEESIPVTPYDVPVDALVSPSGFTPISPVALEKCD